VRHGSIAAVARVRIANVIRAERRGDRWGAHVNLALPAPEVEVELQGCLVGDAHETADGRSGHVELTPGER
jgi:hypothetical protein